MTRKPRGVDNAQTTTLYELYKRLPDAPAGVTLYAVNQDRGRAYFRDRVITVPSWTFRVGARTRRGTTICAEYPLYYLAHELAHIAQYDADGDSDNHGPRFMAHFKRLCPAHLQHYELDYKPRNAKAAGIGR